MAYAPYIPQSYPYSQFAAQPAQARPDGGYVQGYPQAAPPAPVAAVAGAQQSFICRAVTSKAEVIAAQIPFDGSTTYFVDTSTGNIYSKTFNSHDGTAPIKTYIREDTQAVQYATLDDLAALKDDILKQMPAPKSKEKSEVTADDADK